MPQLLSGLYLCLLSVFILFHAFGSSVRDRRILFSYKNLFLLGLVNFQSLSGAIICLTELNERGASLRDPDSASVKFSIILTLFFASFAWLYPRMGAARRLALRASRCRDVGSGGVVVAGIAMLSMGILAKLVAPGLGVLGVLLLQMSAGAICGGICLLMFAWAKSPLNLVAGLIAVGGLIAGSAVLTIGAFGRRDLLSAVVAAPFAWYFARWRDASAAKVLALGALSAVVIAVPVLIFSAARGVDSESRGVQEQVTAAGDISLVAIQDNLLAAASGQFAAGISMWAIETRPGDFPVDPLHSLIYYLTMPIPREWWPAKPEGLGLLLPDQALLSGVSQGFSWGPGLVGHLVHDSVVLALPLYSLILAFFFSYADARLETADRDPGAVAVFGCALGQLWGFARGDIGLFAFHLTAGMVAVWLLLRLGLGYLFSDDRIASDELS